MRTLPLLAAGLLAACSTEPVGGRGPFDPLPDQAQITQPTQGGPAIVAPPSDTGAQPRSASDALVVDVQNALNSGAGSATVQGGVPGENPGIGIDPNAQAIDLNQYSQEQQRIQREEDARRIAEARSQLIVVEPEEVAQVNTDVNVVTFARQTSHGIGEQVYNRSSFRSRSQSASACRGFSSANEAQRQFLLNGGPQADRYNLDPDGDGFACSFDPETYRKLQF